MNLDFAKNLFILTQYCQAACANCNFYTDIKCIVMHSKILPQNKQIQLNSRILSSHCSNLL